MKNSKLNRAIEYIKEDFVWASLLAFVFFCGVSMPLARIFLLISAVGSLVRAIRQHSWARISRPTIGWLAYFVLALVVSIIATCCLNDPQLNPSKGLGKIDKLIWYIGIPIVALSVNSKERFVQLLRWYVIGCLIGAIIVIISYPLKSWIMCNIPKVSHMKNPAIRETIPLLSQWLFYVTEFLGVGDDIWAEIRKYFAYRPSHMSEVFILQGTMQEAQRFMVAVPAAFYLFIDACKQKLPCKQRFKQLIILLLIALALIFTCKRGPLLAVLVVMVPLVFYYFKRITVLVLGLFIAVVFLVPASRARILELPEEFTIEKGGRYAMWTQIVPAVHEEHPYGIGFRSLTTEKMRQHCPNMENFQHSHVHSTPLQALVDFGWLGVAAYAFWYLFTIVSAVIYWKRGAGLYAVIPLVMFTSLALFGLVEYNLADGEIVLLYSLGMGLSDCVFLNSKYSKAQEKSIK